MIALADIKAVAKPKDVARYFLGEPSFERSGKLWYCSPFRNEEHPSFKVDDVGMYDFGSNESYDIFKFVQRLKRCNFQESTKILASLYGINEREYESTKLRNWLKGQRVEAAKAKEKSEWFYLKVWDEVEQEEKENIECLKIFAGDFTDDTYKILVDRQTSIAGEKEYLVEDINTLQDKKNLLKKAEEGKMPKWLQKRVEKYITSSKRSKLQTNPRLRF